MTPHRIVPALLLTLFTWGCGAAAAPSTKPSILGTEEIALQVRPKWAMGMTGSFRVKVTIQNNIDNRALAFMYDGPMSRLSVIQLDELNSDQNTFDFLLENIPSGRYVVQATLYRKVKGETVAFSANDDIAVCGPTEDSCGGGSK